MCHLLACLLPISCTSLTREVAVAGDPWMVLSTAVPFLHLPYFVFSRRGNSMMPHRRRELEAGPLCMFVTVLSILWSSGCPTGLDAGTMASEVYRHWKVKRKRCRFWLRFSRLFFFFLWQVCCVWFLFRWSGGSCADTEACAKHSRFERNCHGDAVDGERTRDALLHKAAATYCEVICHYRMFH